MQAIKLLDEAGIHVNMSSIFEYRYQKPPFPEGMPTANKTCPEPYGGGFRVMFNKSVEKPMPPLAKGTPLGKSIRQVLC